MQNSIWPTGCARRLAAHWMPPEEFRPRKAEDEAVVDHQRSGPTAAVQFRRKQLPEPANTSALDPVDATRTQPPPPRQSETATTAGAARVELVRPSTADAPPTNHSTTHEPIEKKLRPDSAHTVTSATQSLSERVAHHAYHPPR